MDIGFHHDVDAADAVERYFLVLVVPPVAHACHVDTVCLVLLVACCQISKWGSVINCIALAYLQRVQYPGLTTRPIACRCQTPATSYSRIDLRCRRRPHIYETKHLRVRWSAYPRVLDRYPLHILGTKISRLCAIKSSIIFFGLSLISTSLQYTQLCSAVIAAESK